MPFGGQGQAQVHKLRSPRIIYKVTAWLCRYDPEFVPNQSDDTGRYRYEEQPAACYWNCEKLAEAFKAVLSKGRALSWLQSNFYLTYQR